jgi:hypothetical protein
LHTNVTQSCDVVLPVHELVLPASKVWSTQKASVEILAAATVPVAFALTNVQLGFQLPLSVSIRTFTLTDGLPVLARLSFIVLAALPLPKTGKDTRVFAVTSPIFCAEVACAVVGAGSINTTFQTERVSQAG